MQALRSEQFRDVWVHWRLLALVKMGSAEWILQRIRVSCIKIHFINWNEYNPAYINRWSSGFDSLKVFFFKLLTWNLFLRATVIFGLNALNGRVPLSDGSLGGPWNYSNAASLIRYTVNKGHRVSGWELGELSINCTLMKTLVGTWSWS